MRHYLDHASTTPLRPTAVAAMTELIQRLGEPDGAADPGRVHLEGRAARQAVETAREQVAALAGVPPRRVVFTSGGTEAANTAIASALARAQSPVVVSSGVEHSCVREAAGRLGQVRELAVDRTGRIDPEQLATVLTESSPRPALVNCQWANHEVGTVQPVAEVSAICRGSGVPLHVDAAAGFGHVPIDFETLAADYVSVSAHKMGGPAGVGALVLGTGVRLRPLIVGGSEERARRAGAENIIGIVGFGAAAFELSQLGALSAEESRTRQLQAALIEAALAVDGVELVGPQSAGGRLPHIACLSLQGVLGEAALLALDRAGIAAHSGSACSSEALEPSPVLSAMGLDPETSLRLSLGWSSRSDDVSAFATAFPLALEELRRLGRAL